MKNWFILFSVTIFVSLTVAAQNVGIGTINPQEKLHVVDYTSGNVPLTLEANNPGLELKNGNGSVGGLRFFPTVKTSVDLLSTGLQPITLSPNQNTLMTLTPGGRVGIGTTNPAYLFHVYNNADVWHTLIGGSTGVIAFAGQNGNGAVIQSANPSGGGARELYLQRDGGNVGIGNTAPGARLQIDYVSTLSSPQLLLKQTDASFSRLTFANSNGKSFTLAAVNANGVGADYFNVWSERLSKDLLQVTSDPKNSIIVNGSLKVKTAYFNVGNVYDGNGTVNDLDIQDATVIKIDRTGGNVFTPTTITGLSGGVEGRIVYFLNTTLSNSGSLTLNGGDNRSAVGNRFFSTRTCELGSMLTLIYLDGYWHIL